MPFDYSALPSDDAAFLAAAADRVRALATQSILAIVETGSALQGAKSRLGHGNWGPWLAAEFAMSERSAQRFMQAADWAASKSDIVTLLEPTAIYALSARSTPAEVSDTVVARVRAGESFSIETVRALIAQAKERSELELLPEVLGSPIPQEALAPGSDDPIALYLRVPRSARKSLSDLQEKIGDQAYFRVRRGESHWHLLSSRRIERRPPKPRGE